MYLKQSYRKQTGRTYLVIAQKYRDPKTNRSTDRTIRSLGYLDELEKEHADPIAHFREVAKQMTEEESQTKQMTLSFNLEEALSPETSDRKNLGYAALSKIYHELGLHTFVNNKARSKSFTYNTNSILLLLTISRILSPGSKKKAFEEKGGYFERFDFQLVDIYRALSHFASIGTDLQRHVNEQISKQYKRDFSTIYYDVTNYYFEIDRPDELRKFGKSKEHRPNPIVQMGLAMDADGIPLHYQLFPGNKLDQETFRPVIGEVRKNYGTGRIVVVADMGIITGDNIAYLTGKNNQNGYVLSFSIRGGTKEFKDYVLDEDGYVNAKGAPASDEDDFKIKSRRIARDINVTMSNGRKKTKTVYEKQVVFYGKKYADKAKADRAQLVAKAMELAENPGAYRKSSAGPAKYLTELPVNRETGEVLEGQNLLAFNEEKLEREEQFDGYYSIVTSELAMSDQEIIDTYRGLWEIEESFRITKGTLEAQPVYVSREERIDAHFLLCFLSLVILRLLQKKTGKPYSAEKIATCLKQISCSREQDNLYLFDYRSEVSDAIGEALGIDFTKKRLALSQIKNILANTKK